MQIFKFTVRNYEKVNGKLKSIIRYRFIEAENLEFAKKKLDIFPKLILKSEIYIPKSKQIAQ
jgi:hypothetical protein